MAQQRPSIAFIVDLRRDNLVHHLLLKALFHESETRIEYLALLFGREAPADPSEWEAAPISDILAYLEGAPGGEGTEQADSARARVMAAAETFGIKLGPVERSTLTRFHEAFIREGAAIRFTSFGRAPRAGYPTFGELLSLTDLEGERGSYLARREDFVFLKAMQEANRVVPVVGDLSGRSALRAIGEEVRRRGLTVRAFYTSNVEYYLWSAGTFEIFAETLSELPADGRSVIIRSVFPTTAAHPHAVPGYYSTQTLARLQDVQRVVRGSGYRGYEDLVVRHAIDPRGDGR
jgi:hypothetical protein